MTVLATRPAAAPPLPAPPLPRPRHLLRRVLGAVLRWTIAIVLIVVLGELMTPVEARASVRSGAVPY